jgi:hypothetical protein
MSRSVSISSGPPEVGEWVIEPGVPGDGSVAEFDRLARAAVGAFVAAFGEVTRVDSTLAELMWLDPDGRVTRLEELVPATVDSQGRLVVPDDATLVAEVLLDCSLWVRTPNGSRWCADGLRFYYGCVVDFDEEDRAGLTDSSMAVTVGVDAWSGPTGAATRRLLAGALHDWEERSGSPITGWSSSVHPARVDRYGFTDLDDERAGAGHAG